MNGLRGSNLQDNEIVKASDVQMISDGGFENFGKVIKTLFGASKSVVIGGKISAHTSGSSLMAKMNPIMGVHANDENLFIDHEGKFYLEDQEDPSDIITFSSAGTSARRDIIEVKADTITAVELSRQFYDPESESSAYSQTDIEKRQILRLKVKKGTNGSDTAPAVDTGYVKIAEVVIPANAISLTDSNILNVTADIDGVDNIGWTNDKQSTVNPGTIQDIKDKFRQIHNSDGSLKDDSVSAAKILLSGAGALQGSGIQKGGSGLTIDGETLSATTSISDFIAKIAAKLNKTWSVAEGGTGATTEKGANYSLLKDMNEVTTAVDDNTLIAGVYATPSATNGTLHKRKLSTFKSWIKGLFASGTGTTYDATNGKFSVTYGTAANTACQGNDSRLSNKREPTAHASTATTYGVSSATQYGHAMATTTTPKANGVTGSLGNETAKFARGDHVHPESYSVPVGFIYFQLPGELAPNATDASGNALMFPKSYVWEDITKKYSGLFFRAEGGNAKTFDSCCYKVSSKGSTTVTLVSVSGISVGDSVVLVNDDDHSQDKTMEVKGISGNTLDFGTGATIPAKITNVLITQGDLNKSHNHTITDNGHSHNFSLGYEYSSNIGGYPVGANIAVGSSSLSMSASKGTSINSTGIKLAASGGVESRPVNTSIRIWKRTA